eukprot:TRINITY_DN1249_c0_g1_i1.p1 TRINITY_DN1249_c0_g1~~TRINITY_DN1249_c0_g1_i1.p1  ORF type:complete len:410 (+),score=142.95 TRINITY_DN1249_c0_g1_i1:60-1289(+)
MGSSRDRSRSPHHAKEPRPQQRAGTPSVAAEKLRAAMAKAAALRAKKSTETKTSEVSADIQPCQPSEAFDASAVSDSVSGAAAGAADIAQAEKLQESALSEVAAVRCYGCGHGFATEQELRSHLIESGASCSGPALQAAIGAIACLPGAGQRLWCPACPDAFVGKWTGSATKAAAFLRHTSTASKAIESPEVAPEAHAWLLAGIVDLLFTAPPPPPPPLPGGMAEEVIGPSGEEASGKAEEEQRLQAWVDGSPLLMGVIGPLLAKGGPTTRAAIRFELEREENCKVLGAAPFPFNEDTNASAAADADIAAKDEAKNAKKKLEPTGPKYDFYNEDIPMDVFLDVQDQTERTADGVPVMDLLESDEEGETEAAAKAKEEAEGMTPASKLQVHFSAAAAAADAEDVEEIIEL